MRIASEMDFEVQPDDHLDFVIDSVADVLNKAREINPEKQITLKVFVDMEMQ